MASVLDTYQRMIADGLRDYEAFHRHMRPMVGRVRRLWLSPPLYKRFSRAVWAYECDQSKALRFLREDESYTFCGMQVLPRKART